MPGYRRGASELLGVPYPPAGAAARSRSSPRPPPRCHSTRPPPSCPDGGSRGTTLRHVREAEPGPAGAEPRCCRSSPRPFRGRFVPARRLAGLPGPRSSKYPSRSPERRVFLTIERGGERSLLWPRHRCKRRQNPALQ